MTKNLIKTARHKCNMRVARVGWPGEGHKVVGAGLCYCGANKINDCNKSSDSGTDRETGRQTGTLIVPPART